MALLYSGGPGSTVLLYDLLLRGNKVHALTFNFGEQEAGNEKSCTSVQPFGSTITLMLAASWALRRDLRDVYYAAHLNDSAFHDNHPEYFSLLGRVTAECEGREYRMNFHTPYLAIPKADVIRLGNKLGVPFGNTWSCALGGAFHCGTCDPCVDRRMSFEVAGVEDPVHYVSNILPSAEVRA